METPRTRRQHDGNLPLQLLRNVCWTSLPIITLVSKFLIVPWTASCDIAYILKSFQCSARLCELTPGIALERLSSLFFRKHVSASFWLLHHWQTQRYIVQGFFFLKLHNFSFSNLYHTISTLISSTGIEILLCQYQQDTILMEACGYWSWMTDKVA